MSATDETQTRVIDVRQLARVEGEGSLHLEIRAGKVTKANFSLYEPPRFFEAFLRGRSYREVPDITALVSALGGREVHPINARVGGFHRLPERAELVPVAEQLWANRQFAVDACRLLGSLDFPDFEMPYESVALRHPDEVAICEGSVFSSRGLEVTVPDFLEHFEEVQVDHSNALQGIRKEHGPYLVGPLARLNLNWDLYPDQIKKLAGEIGFSLPCNNQFKSIIARGLETLYALDHAVEIIENYERPQDPAVEITPRAGEGHGCTEAPRGILYHRYRTDENGLIEDAVICPPTAQNQSQIETDLAEFASRILDLDHDQMTLRCEQLIRSYDPCISCATHFLKLTVNRADR